MEIISCSISYAKCEFSVARTKMKFGHRIDGWPKGRPQTNLSRTQLTNILHELWPHIWAASISFVARTGKLIVFQELGQPNSHLNCAEQFALKILKHRHLAN